MELLRVYCAFVFIFAFSLQVSFGFEDDDEPVLSSAGRGPPRVDAGVKRPYRACQGFEDPEEIDCYIRSDLKKYVCTEPATFNPCESDLRLTTYHYDHIKHRCDKVNLPACNGQIIRSMSLIQCLIYCHNNDPFALGKSTSMVFKLNQKKPYVIKDEELEEREKVMNFVNDEDLRTDNVKETETSNGKEFLNNDVDKKVSKTKEETNSNIEKSLDDKSTKTDKIDVKEVNVKISSDKKTEMKKKSDALSNINTKATSNKIKEVNVKKDSKENAQKKSEVRKVDNVKKDAKVAIEVSNVKPVAKKESSTVLKDNVIKEEKKVNKNETTPLPQVKSVVETKDVKPVEKKETKISVIVDKKASTVSDLKAVAKKEPEKTPQAKSLIDNTKKENTVKDSKKEPGNIPQEKSTVDGTKKENILKIFKPDVKKGLPDVHEIPEMISNSKKKDITKSLKPIETLFQQLKASETVQKIVDELDTKEKKKELEVKKEKDLVENVIERNIEEKKGHSKKEVNLSNDKRNSEKKSLDQSPININDVKVHLDNKDKEVDDGFYLWDE